MVFQRIFALFLTLLLLLTACGPSAPDTQETPSGEPSPSVTPYQPPVEKPDAPIQGGAILHAFCWSFQTIAENMADIAAAGFTAVQTSPITECITTSPWSPKPEGLELWGEGAWWFHYQPISYRIGNYQLGSEEEFAEMCRIAKEHGVKILVDFVPNHFSSDYAQIRDEIKDIEGGALRMENVSGGGRLQQTQGRLLGLYDVNTHNPNVQQEVLKTLKRCIELGASGFRFDAVFHIELPDEEEGIRSDFWNVVLDNGAEFQYGELLGASEAAVYSKYMKVTDAVYGHAITHALRSGQFNAPSLQNYRVNAPAASLITWVESHDTYCNEGETADLTPRQILYGWAVLAARDGSTPLYFSRPAGSSPGLDNRWGDNVIGKRGDDAFKSKEVTELNWFKRAVNGLCEHFTNPTGDDRLLMIERGAAGAVIINAGPETRLDGVAAHHLTDGSYTDRIGGNVFTVADGQLSGTVGAESVAVFYNEAAPSPDNCVPLNNNQPVAPQDGETAVYFDNTEGWEEVYCYIYAPTFGGVAENAPWPGVEMTLVAENLYKYVLPDEFETDIHVMFNDNGERQFPAPRASGLPIGKGQRMILENGALIPYIERIP
jgi:alpha-amylase